MTCGFARQRSEKRGGVISILHMEYYNGIVCVTYNDLLSTDGGEAILKKDALKFFLHTHSDVRVTSGAGQTGYVRIDYYALPQRYRDRFEAKYGDPRKLLEDEIRREKLSLDADPRARDYYRTYAYIKNGTVGSLTEELQERYTLNATVLNRLRHTLNDRKVMRKKSGGSIAGIWDTIHAESEELRELYGHTLPSAPARLKAVMNRYQKEGYRALISGKIGNSNAISISEDVAKYLIALKRSRKPVYTNAQIFEKYNLEAEVRGWNPLKDMDYLNAWLGRPEIEPLWYDAVHGELAASQRYGRKHRTEMASMRDSLWYGDGTRLNLYYREHVKGRGWVVKTMQVYEVIDAYSEVMLGYHISETENAEAQYNALRMAVQTSGCRPYEFVHDNQGGHKKIGEWLDKIARVRRPTAPYSGQSKTIESVFGRFQAEILHQDWRFTGQNITARKASSRPNLELIKANIDRLYTLDELKEAYAEARRRWNEGKHHATGMARMEMYRTSVNPSTGPVSIEDMVDMFWLTTARPSAYTDSGITVQVAGRKYHYEVMSAPGQPDHAFLRENLGRKFYVKYDPSDMLSVRLYTMDKDGSMRFVRIAEPYIKIHRAIQEQQEGERAFIAANIEANRQSRIERQIAARTIERECGMSVEEAGLRRPLMAGMPKARETEGEIEREVRRRTRRYSAEPELLDPGRLGKKISNMLYSDLPGEVVFDQRKVAGKL